MKLHPPDAEQDIVTRFRYVARALANHLAVEDGRSSLSYAALDQKSSEFAAQLSACRGTAPEPVALILPNRADFVVGMLGTLKAGKFFVPLDVHQKPEGLRPVLDASAAAVVLTSSELYSLAEEVVAHHVQIIDVDRPGITWEESTGDVILTSATYASAAFTSGTTGSPKGVLWHHGGWLHRARQCCLYDQIRPTDRVAQLLSPAFGLSITVVLGALLNGATLVYPKTGEVNAHTLVQWLYDQAITIWFTPVGLMREAIRAPRHIDKLPAMRAILPGGQKLLAQDLVGLPELASATCVISNRLGMSEIHMATRYVVMGADIRPTPDPLPVGYPCEGNEIYLWDVEGKPVPLGEVGQIVVRSRYLSPGYWRDPDLTNAKFLPDPEGGDQRLLLTGDMGRMRPDGCLEFVARKDLMVKIRGFSVEPEAIEAALRAHADVDECAVVARPGLDGESRLFAYVSLRQGAFLSTNELRSLLAKSLPSYMIPARFVCLERLPRNTSGKIDRAALPPPGLARPDLGTPFVAPRTVLERQIAGIWAELLELDEVGVDDNFYEVGGDSILALRLGLEIERRLGQRVPASYFHKPTVALLASALEDETVAIEAPSLRQSAGAGRSNPWMGRIRRVLRGQINTSALLGQAVQEIAMRLTYRQGWRLLVGWCGQPIVQDFLYCRERALLQRLAGALDSPAPSRAGLRFFLVNNMIYAALQRWRAGKLFQSDGLISAMAGNRRRFWRSLAEQAEQGDVPGQHPLIVYDGYEHFARAHAQGRGTILLTYHCTSGPLASALLARRAQCGPIVNLGQAQAGARAVLMDDDAPAAEAVGKSSSFALGDARGAAHVARRTAWSAVLSYEGMNILRAGGVVLIANDTGYNPAGAVPRVIGGRLYQLKPGFAELALATGAAVVPVYSSYGPNGAISMSFLPPLAAAPGLAHAAQVDDLVNQYVRFLEAAWRTAPESMRRGDLVDHFARPPAPGLEATSL